MGSKPAVARADQAASVSPVPRLSRVRPRRWHPVVYLASGPVRFAGCNTIADAMDEARAQALALGARTWSAVPGRASIVAPSNATVGQPPQPTAAHKDAPPRLVPVVLYDTTSRPGNAGWRALPQTFPVTEATAAWAAAQAACEADSEAIGCAVKLAPAGTEGGAR